LPRAGVWPEYDPPGSKMTSSAMDLDDPKTYDTLDPSAMGRRIRELPQQCLAAWKQASEFELPADYREVNRVIVLGMGGSAIGGDLLGALNAVEGGASVSVHRGYDIPAFLDHQALLVASSYSGSTEETVSAFECGMASDAKKVILTTGGELASLGKRKGIPVYHIRYEAAPRAAIAHSLFALVGMCRGLGLTACTTADVEQAVSTMEELQTIIDPAYPLESNPAKQMAVRLRGRLACVYAGEFLAPVAQRWKTQINENSKAWAFAEELPELNHNSVVGYRLPEDTAREVQVVFLRSPLLHERMLRRYEVTGDLLSRAGVAHEVVDGNGSGYLDQMMSLLLFGDWVSYYLAMLYGIDPTPVEAIDYLKQSLSKRTG